LLGLTFGGGLGRGGFDLDGELTALRLRERWPGGEHKGGKGEDSNVFHIPSGQKVGRDGLRGVFRTADAGHYARLRGGGEMFFAPAAAPAGTIRLSLKA
jgi:hypothetical protein